MFDEEKRREYNRIKTKEWRAKNLERWREIQRESLRRCCIRTPTGRIWGVKRPRPKNGQCELCVDEKRLHYHHFDDADTLKGIWVCPQCHQFVERLEKVQGILEKYSKLKSEVCN